MNRSLRLPTSLTIGGVGFPIHTDYRRIEYIVELLQSEEFDDEEKAILCLRLLFKSPSDIPPEGLQEAIQKAYDFIGGGFAADGTGVKSRPQPELMRWEQDIPLIISAINAKIGRDIREDEYLHWWTFLNYYMEIDRNSLFATVVSIRAARRKRKLDKSEQEFYSANKALVDIHHALSDEDREWLERCRAIVRGG